MIRYRLECDRHDQFEAWFRSSDDYDAQAAGGEIECPNCGSIAVHKALMAPAVRSSKRAAPIPPTSTGPTAPADDPAPKFVAGPDRQLADAIEAVRRATRLVRDNAENVGRRFPEEARKIHYKEVPERSIIGEASHAEAEALAEEGIAFHPLPVLPEDRN